MTRRDFLMGASIIPIVVANTNNIGTSSLENELIGIIKPPLFGDGYQLRKEASDSFLKMKTAAQKEGISLIALSSYRDFDHQSLIWNKKYDKYSKQGLNDGDIIEKITHYSSIPGTSRHHWGTEIDVIDGNKKLPSDPLNEKHFHGNGIYASMKKWLDLHSSEFGFEEVYTNDLLRPGFKYEPWHFTYKPLSIGYLSAYLRINFQHISGHFKNLGGSSYLTEKYFEEYKTKYLLGINPILKPI